VVANGSRFVEKCVIQQGAIRARAILRALIAWEHRFSSRCLFQLRLQGDARGNCGPVGDSRTCPCTLAGALSRRNKTFFHTHLKT